MWDVDEVAYGSQPKTKNADPYSPPRKYDYTIYIGSFLVPVIAGLERIVPP